MVLPRMHRLGLDVRFRDVSRRRLLTVLLGLKAMRTTRVSSRLGLGLGLKGLVYVAACADVRQLAAVVSDETSPSF